MPLMGTVNLKEINQDYIFQKKPKVWDFFSQIHNICKKYEKNPFDKILK